MLTHTTVGLFSGIAANEFCLVSLIIDILKMIVYMYWYIMAIFLELFIVKLYGMHLRFAEKC